MPDSPPDGWQIPWPTWPQAAVGLGLFVLFAALSLLATGLVLVKLPADYFAGDAAPAFWADRRPTMRWAGRLLKNLIGLVLVVVGILLSVPGVPGQGALTILIGLMFVDIPGKRRLERWIVQRPSVLAFVNRLRARYGRGPLVFEEKSPPTDFPGSRQHG